MLVPLLSGKHIMFAVQRKKKSENDRLVRVIYLATYYPANHHANYKIRGNIIHNNHALPFT